MRELLFPQLFHACRQETLGLCVKLSSQAVVSNVSSNGCDVMQQHLGKKMAAWCPLGEYSVGFNAPLEALCLDKCPFSMLHEGRR